MLNEFQKKKKKRKLGVGLKKKVDSYDWYLSGNVVVDVITNWNLKAIENKTIIFFALT